MWSRPWLGVLLVTLAWPAPASACRVLAVTKANVAYAHERTIQAAVDRARPCDWILVAPGVYRETVVIRTPRLHLRGLDRNRVVLDGGHRPGNGIEIRAADGVWIENLTVRNFDRASLNGEGKGNEIWWNGGGHGRIGLHGFHGNYLTAYATGLLGGYGLYAANADGGEWDNVYASGFNDSGLYLGACRDCRARISHALAERNALGFAGSNAGGHLLVEDSLFRDNAIGLSPNSTESDPPPPQLGTCDAGANRRATPSIRSTALARCTLFRRNRVLANNNPTTPSNTSSVRPGFGIGIVLLGAYGDLFADNVVAGNRNVGILALEFPFARPARPGLPRFQLAGNRFERNTVSGSRLDIALEGGLFGSHRSVDNCFLGNRYRRSLPADLRPFACTKTRTPNPDEASSRLVLRLVLRLHNEFLSRHPRGQPAPPPQATMPDPCRGVPRNPLCAKRSDGRSRVTEPLRRRVPRRHHQQFQTTAVAQLLRTPTRAPSVSWRCGGVPVPR